MKAKQNLWNELMTEDDKHSTTATSTYYRKIVVRFGSPDGVARRIKKIDRQIDDLRRERDDLAAARRFFLRRELTSV